MIGGGAYPLDNLESWGIKLNIENNSEKDLEVKLRGREIPIIVRIVDGKIVIDCKTIFNKDYDIITKAIEDISGENND